MQEMQSVTQFVSRLRLTRREVTMELILDTQPYMLYETIAMLTKYVNRISMLDIRDTLLRLYRSGLDETWRRRLECRSLITALCWRSLPGSWIRSICRNSGAGSFRQRWLY